MEQMIQMFTNNINKKVLAGVVSVLLLGIFLAPTITLAIEYTPLVQCGTAKYTAKCDFNAFIGMINRIINWIISIAGVIFTISAIWGGFLYMTSGQNPGNKDKAKKILYSTLTGFIIILVSWVIVYTILVNLVGAGPYQDSIFKFIGKK